MTLPIHDQGGLTAAEIQLRIEESYTQQAITLEDKLKDHRDAIDRRLCTTEEAVRDLTAQTSEMKGNVAALIASDAKQTELLEKIVAKGDEWHAQDIDFRAVLVQRVSKIEVEQTELATQLRLLRWASGTSNVVAKAAGFIVSNDTVRAMLILGMLALIAHAISPSLYLLVRQALEIFNK